MSWSEREGGRGQHPELPPRDKLEQKIWELHAAEHQLVVERYQPNQILDFGNWRTGQIFCVKHKFNSKLNFEWYIVNKHAAQKILVAENLPEMRLNKAWLNHARLGPKIKLPARVAALDAAMVLNLDSEVELSEIYRVMPAGSKIIDRVFGLGILKSLLAEDPTYGFSIDDPE